MAFRPMIPADEQYRYDWRIELDDSNRGSVLIIMKNPSWPDEGNVCFSKASVWARHNAFSSVLIGNLFARRAYDPRTLNELTYDAAVGSENDRALATMAAEAKLVVAAWGQPSGISPSWYDQRVDETVDLVGYDRLTMLEATAAGHPKHPQVWASTMRVRDWLPPVLV